MSEPQPPYPPTGVPFYVDRKKGTISIAEGFGRWSVPAAGATIHTVDNTGQRVTVTRIALTGILAWALKKRTGDLSMIVVSEGDSRTASIKPKHAAEAMTWAVQYNAWSEAAALRRPDPA